MNLGSEDRAEMAVDIAAAAIFAGATGFAIWAIAPGPAVVVTAAGAGFLAAAFGLRRIKPETHSYRLPAVPLETIEPTQAACGEGVDELILEDALGEVSPHARVVRLFGPSQSHLPSNHARPAPPDASQALVEALAELRRSLH